MNKFYFYATFYQEQSHDKLYILLQKSIPNSIQVPAQNKFNVRKRIVHTPYFVQKRSSV